MSGGQARNLASTSVEVIVADVVSSTIAWLRRLHKYQLFLFRLSLDSNRDQPPLPLPPFYIVHATFSIRRLGLFNTSFQPFRRRFDLRARRTTRWTGRKSRRSFFASLTCLLTDFDSLIWFLSLWTLLEEVIKVKRRGCSWFFFWMNLIRRLSLKFVEIKLIKIRDWMTILTLEHDHVEFFFKFFIYKILFIFLYIRKIILEFFRKFLRTSVSRYFFYITVSFQDSAIRFLSFQITMSVFFFHFQL